MLREATPLTILTVVWTLVAAPGVALARVVEIFPSNADASCNEEFENVANTLKPETPTVRTRERSRSNKELARSRSAVSSATPPSGWWKSPTTWSPWITR